MTQDSSDKGAKQERTITEESKMLSQLCVLVESLSVHQRQLATKIEALHAHHEQLYAQQNQIYSQVDALFSIFSMINIRHPLPTMRGWPVSPDFVKVLISLIHEIKPSLIVETGSGVSTIISGYCLESIGHGTISSLDHDEKFAEETRQNLIRHELNSIGTIHHCPIGEVTVGEEICPWYTLPSNLTNSPIDLLVIDGPPANLGAMARYPALPLFFENLSEHAVILMDDAAREGERKIIERWMNMYKGFDYTYLETEKGTVILRRRPDIR